MSSLLAPQSRWRQEEAARWIHLTAFMRYLYSFGAVFYDHEYRCI